MNIEKAERRLVERSQRRLREHSEKTGQGFVLAIGSGGGMTLVDGDHHSSMIAFEDGNDATVHFYVYRGTPFEITETIEVSDDGRSLIRRERITVDHAAGCDRILHKRHQTG